jgi:hypothetical protein
MKTIFCLYPNVDDARAAIKILVERRFPRGEMNIIVQEQTAKNELGINPRSANIPVTGNNHTRPLLDQMLIGKQPLILPDTGGLYSSGELANIMTRTALSARTGRKGTGLYMALEDFGLAKDTARYYDQGIKSGEILFFIRVKDERASEAASLLRSQVEIISSITPENGTAYGEAKIRDGLPTDIINREKLLELMKIQEPCSLSIYMPVHPIGQDVMENPILLKNIIDQAENQLHQNGLSTSEISHFLEPLRDLTNQRNYWQRQNRTLAIFRTKDTFETFRLPLETHEIVYINDRLYTKPLIQLLEGNGKFYVLALSINRTRFFQGDRYSIKESKLKDTPTSMAEALGDTYVQKQVQFHTNIPRSSRGERSSIVFSQGSSTENLKKEEIQRFFQYLEKGVHKEISNQSSPLVLAGVEYLIPIYREVSEYSHLYPEYLTGNPDDLRPEDLHLQAWRLVDPFFKKARLDAIDGYHILANDHLATKEIEDVITAAYYGQVDILFVADGIQIWGKFNKETNHVIRHDYRQPNDEDLSDLATFYTLNHGGIIYTFDPAEMPDGSMIAATLRYPFQDLNSPER